MLTLVWKTTAKRPVFFHPSTMNRAPSRQQKTQGGVYNGTGTRHKHTSAKLKKQQQQAKRAAKTDKQRLRALQELRDAQHVVQSSQEAPRVAVVGGGAAGLASLRQLLAAGCHATLFERDASVGGLWQYRPKPTKRGSADDLDQATVSRMARALPTGLDVPLHERVLPFQGRDELAESRHLATLVPDPVHDISDHGNSSSRARLAALERSRRHHANQGTRSASKEPMVGPMYEHLTCNLPTEIMAYLDAPFPRRPPSHSSFVGHRQVTQYLHHYAQHHDLLPHVRTSTTVLEAVPVYPGGEGGQGGQGGKGEEKKRGAAMEWQVDTRNNNTDVTTRHTFDWVVVANGHYGIPDKVPVQSVQNLQLYPGTIMHSVEFDDVASFTGLNVVVVGAKASGSDIAHAISRTASQVYICDRHYGSASHETPEAREAREVGGEGTVDNCYLWQCLFDNDYFLTMMTS